MTIGTIKAATANDTSSVVHTRPPRAPRSLAVRSQPPVHRSMLSPDEHFEIATYLQREPSKVVSRRAVSVPPSRPSVPRWFPSSSGVYYGRHQYVPAAVPTRVPPATTHALPSDAVVGVAHTSLYGDIVIGIPCKKRFMFNAQVPFSAYYRIFIIIIIIIIIFSPPAQSL